MQLSVEMVLAIAGAIISAQSGAIVWLAKAHLRCWELRAAADERAREHGWQSTRQTERAVRAGRELAQ